MTFDYTLAAAVTAGLLVYLGWEEANAFKKNSLTPSPRRWSATPARRSRSGPPTSIASA